MSSKFCTISEAFASQLLQNLEEMFPCYLCVVSGEQRTADPENRQRTAERIDKGLQRESTKDCRESRQIIIIIVLYFQ